MSIPIYGPIVLLRCKKCGRKTDHVLINTATTEQGEIEETYECQECGETKKIYEFATSHVRSLMQDSVTKLKEPQEKDHTEVTIRKKRRLF